jgi:hypothetical protein
MPVESHHAPKIEIHGVVPHYLAELLARMADRRILLRVGFCKRMTQALMMYKRGLADPRKSDFFRMERFEGINPTACRRVFKRYALPVAD